MISVNYNRKFIAPRLSDCKYNEFNNLSAKVRCLITVWKILTLNSFGWVIDWRSVLWPNNQVSLKVTLKIKLIKLNSDF